MKKNVIGRAGTAFALVGALALAGCSGSSAPSEDAVSSVLDPSDPVQVELWTYYNGTQQQAFEDLVKDFNATKGKDLGIVVTSSSQGGVNDLASAVTDSAQELVGSEAMPDAFLSYSDTASVIDGFGMVADRAAVVEAMAAGASSEEAVAPYLDDAGFDAWLADLETQLREAIA